MVTDSLETPSLCRDKVNWLNQPEIQRSVGKNVNIAPSFRPAPPFGVCLAAILQRSIPEAAKLCRVRLSAPRRSMNANYEEKEPTGKYDASPPSA